MISVDQALAQTLALVAPLPSEEVALSAALGRMPSEPLHATRDHPPFAASAMDGYALSGTASVGQRYRVIGEVAAGTRFEGVLNAGEALRIFTGAPIPQGADRVVAQEDVERIGAEITLTEDCPANRHIRPRGNDFLRGTPFAPRVLRAVDLALLAAMNIPRLHVHRRARIAIIPTGDELVEPGCQPNDSQIIASNSYALQALITSCGAEPILLPITRDTAPALQASLREAAEKADLILTIGGASVGEHDVIAQLDDPSFERHFHKVALRPGKPLLAGRYQGVPLLGLPGNPASSLVCALLFLRPMIARLQGEPAASLAPRTAICTHPLPQNGPRRHFMRARVQDQDGTNLPQITPDESQDSGQLSGFARANALLIRPEHAPQTAAGAMVTWLALP